jgi:hypothetical protein
VELIRKDKEKFHSARKIPPNGKQAVIEGNKAHLNMHIYYRLMTTVGKKSLTHPHSKRVSAAPDNKTEIFKMPAQPFCGSY